MTGSRPKPSVRRAGHYHGQGSAADFTACGNGAGFSGDCDILAGDTKTEARLFAMEQGTLG